MKKFAFSVMTSALLACMSCGQSSEQKAAEQTHEMDSIAARKKRIETMLDNYEAFIKETGHTSNTGWYCPDNIQGFPPVDIKLWNKVPVVNGRLPTYEETEDGTSLIYYDTSRTPDAKPYGITLPKLATLACDCKGNGETIIVIQIVQTAKDTVVGYRFLTGGNGTSHFRDVHFLADNEITK